MHDCVCHVVFLCHKVTLLQHFGSCYFIFPDSAKTATSKLSLLYLHLIYCVALCCNVMLSYLNLLITVDEKR